MQFIKNAELGEELLDAIQQLRQLKIIKIPGHSTATTMEAKRSQIALRSQIIQTREYSLLPAKSIKDSLGL